MEASTASLDPVLRGTLAPVLVLLQGGTMCRGNWQLMPLLVISMVVLQPVCRRPYPRACLGLGPRGAEVSSTVARRGTREGSSAAGVEHESRDVKWMPARYVEPVRVGYCTARTTNRGRTEQRRVTGPAQTRTYKPVVLPGWILCRPTLNVRVLVSRRVFGSLQAFPRSIGLP